MSGFAIAWLVIACCAFGGGVALYFLLQRLDKPLIRNIIIAMALVFFLVPAPVPNHADQLAPAFVVCIFETFFQIEGEPAVSLRILLLALGGTAVVVSLGHYLVALRARRALD